MLTKERIHRCIKAALEDEYGEQGITFSEQIGHFGMAMEIAINDNADEQYNCSVLIVQPNIKN